MIMKVKFSILILLLAGFNSQSFAGYSTSSKPEIPSPPSKHNFNFKSLPVKWDEGLPLGNGMLGALIWQKDKSLRISMDRADLWDTRTPKEFDRPEFKFSWVVDRVKKNEYEFVQKLFDEPYNREAYPTKLPAAAIEFDIPGIRDVKSVDLFLKEALCEIVWKSGIKFTSFVHATMPYGWFKLEGVSNKVIPRLSPPSYDSSLSGKGDSGSGPAGNELARLGYPAPQIQEGNNQINYHQICADGFSYDVRISWTYSNKTLLGTWTVTTNKPYSLAIQTDGPPSKIIENEFKKDLKSHKDWWNKYWSKSSIQIPDPILETQYYRELYKFGSASRKGAPPISLQAIWTADNGKLPPWKGDFHNDLNTQMSYWPGYSSNHLEESSVFTDWLWNCKPEAEMFTKKYFETDGLNFPGVATLEGKPMGG
ncbi:MAG: hypothetical protein CVV24_06985, partial [Ignavibacteriae bacterium HGW-Ignavibacteriae-3]